MDVAALVNSFATGSYAVTRRSASTFVNGRAQPGTSSMLQVAACVQPASGQDLLRLPEGQRTTETRTLYTVTELYPGGKGSSFEADRLLIDGRTWEVQHVEPWTGPGSSTYYRCIVQVVVS